ncbi:MAG: hypothetical protein R2697_16455 [Ilumatobacteraceae bacterium]
MDELDLRDLRSVVAAANDPMVARDDSAKALIEEMRAALVTKQEQELQLWFGDVDAALAVGRVVRALRLSSQPPKAGVVFPTDIAQRLVDSTNASLAPMDSPDRWIAMLEAAAFSPIRARSVRPASLTRSTTICSATVKRLAPALPQVAEMFEIEVDPKAPMPKPLRPGPNRKGKKAAAKRLDQSADRAAKPKRLRRRRSSRRTSLRRPPPRPRRPRPLPTNPPPRRPRRPPSRRKPPRPPRPRRPSPRRPTTRLPSRRRQPPRRPSPRRPTTRLPSRRTPPRSRPRAERPVGSARPSTNTIGAHERRRHFRGP